MGTLKVNVGGNPSNYSYIWTYEDFETGEIVEVGTTQSISFDPCWEGEFCATVIRNETGCSETECVPYYPPLHCELCLIGVPGGLNSSYEGDNVKLTWDETPGAVSYTVRVTYFDPECCPFSEIGPIVKLFDTTEPMFVLNTGKSSLCFSWQVIAVCDGSGQSISQKKCGWTPVIDGVPSKRDKSINPKELSIYPNPTQSNATIAVENIIDQEVRLEVFSFDGKVIMNQLLPINSQNGRFTKEIGDQLEPGVYIVRVSSETMNISKKLVIQR